MSRLTTAALAVCLILSGITGCEPRPQSHAAPNRGNGFVVSTVHIGQSFTKIFSGGETTTLSVYAGLFDQYDDAVKALGTWRFELYEYRPQHADPRGHRFETGGLQEVDLSDVQENQKHWDKITRGYRFQLTGPPLPENWTRVVLQVSFVQRDGRRLEDTLIIQRR